MAKGPTARMRDRQWLSSRLTAAVTVLATFALAGCEAKTTRVPVAGQVRLDGTPLSAGEIRFVPTTGRPASASIESEGRFSLTSATVGEPTRNGVLPGVYKVAVSTVQIVDDESVTWVAPQKYANHLTSGITVTIEKPTDSLMIDLTSAVEDGEEPNATADQAASRDSSDPLPANE